MNKNSLHSGTVTLTSAQRTRRACSVILPLCFVSLFLSAAIISVANDMYAFVKPQRSITVYTDTAPNIFLRAKMLEENGVINNPTVFSIYVLSKGAEERVCAFSGELELDRSMSYREILKNFS